MLVVLLPGTRSNYSRSNDARFMHKLFKQAQTIKCQCCPHTANQLTGPKPRA